MFCRTDPRRYTADLVVDIRNQLIEALDIYSRQRQAVLENECALKLVHFLLGAHLCGSLSPHHWVSGGC